MSDFKFDFDCDGKFGALDKVVRDDLFSSDKSSSSTSIRKANKTTKTTELTSKDFIIISVFMFILALISLWIVVGIGFNDFTMYFLALGIVEFMISIFCFVCGIYYSKKEKKSNYNKVEKRR